LPIDDSATLYRYTPSDKSRRDVTQVSLGCHVSDAALPHVDPGDSETVLDGFCKRVAVQMPTMRPDLEVQFIAFVDAWLKKEMIPLAVHSDVSVPTWLSKTHYPAYRKEELYLKFTKIQDKFDKKFLQVKSFIKDEVYTAYKHARTINSRTDEYKTLVGPIFKLIEEQLFQRGEFIKKIPVSERPKFLLEKFYNKYKYLVCTDFTSFEAHFVRLLEICEIRLYDYMTQQLPTGREFMKLVRNGLLGENKLIFKTLTAGIYRRRMSGEMCTSLGNGFTNFMLSTFITQHLMGEHRLNACEFEGDDGLNGVQSLPPSSTWLYHNLGIDVKMDVVESVELASFCGNVFDPTDLLVVTNPLEAIVGFGWTTGRYKRSKEKRLKELLRSKSLSLLYQYRGNPILSELAQYGLRVTQGVRAKHEQMNEYQREEYARMEADIKQNGLPIVTPPGNTRALVCKLYGITIADQLAIEEYLRNKVTLSPIDCVELKKYLSSVWTHYYEHFSATVHLTYQLDCLFPAYLHPR